jgi:hypothetical protein
MAVPKIDRHYSGRKDIADEYGRPSQSVEKRFGEHQRGTDEAKLKDDKEQENAETGVDISFG